MMSRGSAKSTRPCGATGLGMGWGSANYWSWKPRLGIGFPEAALNRASNSSDHPYYSYPINDMHWCPLIFTESLYCNTQHLRSLVFIHSLLFHPKARNERPETSSRRIWRENDKKHVAKAFFHNLIIAFTVLLIIFSLLSFALKCMMYSLQTFLRLPQTRVKSSNYFYMEFCILVP